jgi:hypothetical protein
MEGVCGLRIAIGDEEKRSVDAPQTASGCGMSLVGLVDCLAWVLGSSSGSLGKATTFHINEP